MISPSEWSRLCVLLDCIGRMRRLAENPFRWRRRTHSWTSQNEKKVQMCERGDVFFRANCLESLSAAIVDIVFEVYRSRAFRFIELLSIHGWRMKLYGIACNGVLPRASLLGAARRIAGDARSVFAVWRGAGERRRSAAKNVASLPVGGGRAAGVREAVDVLADAGGGCFDGAVCSGG